MRFPVSRRTPHRHCKRSILTASRCRSHRGRSCIRELREKLGDDEHLLIKTVSRRGYLLDATVTAPAGAKAEAPTGPVGLQSRPVQPAWDHLAPRLREEPQRIIAKFVALLQVTRRTRRRALAAAASVLACAGAAGLYLLTRSNMPIGNRGQPVTKSVSTPAVTQSPRLTFKDCDVCPEMVALPAGEFMMGSPENELYRQQVEGLPRRVIIAKPIAIGRFEVTVAQFSAFLAETQIVAGKKCRVAVSTEVPPISWTPEHLCSRSPQWPESTHRTRRSSGGK